MKLNQNDVLFWAYHKGPEWCKTALREAPAPCLYRTRPSAKEMNIVVGWQRTLVLLKRAPRGGNELMAKLIDLQACPLRKHNVRRIQRKLARSKLK